MTNLQAGSIQLMNSNLTNIEVANTIENTDGLKVNAAESSNTVDLFEIGKHNFEPFNDNKVLEAMFLCLDRETINEMVYGGRGKAATSVYPSGTKYYVESDTLGFDIEKAKQILSETEYADGFEFDLEVLAGNTAAEQEAILWQANLSQLGIVVNVKVEEMSVWLDSYLNRTYQMIWNQYGMVGSDPATFDSIILSQLFDYQAKDIPELKDLILEGASTSDEDVRKANYERIQEIVAEYRPVTTIIELPQLFGSVENLEGFEVNGMGHMFLKNITIK